MAASWARTNIVNSTQPGVHAWRRSDEPAAGIVADVWDGGSGGWIIFNDTQEESLLLMTEWESRRIRAVAEFQQDLGLHCMGYLRVPARRARSSLEGRGAAW